MPKVALPIGGGSYPSESPPISQQRDINLYVNEPQAAALSQQTLFGTAGIEQKATTGTLEQVNRGSFTFKDRDYRVNGDKLYRTNRTIVEEVESFATEDLGTIANEGRVFMRSNGTQLMILAPGTTSVGYIFTDDPDSLVTITDTGFTSNGNPETLEYILGFFTVTTDEAFLIVSGQNDGTSWDALDRIAADADPDPLVGQFEFKGQLFLFGTVTTQVAVVVATSGTPLQIQANFELSKGLSGPFAVTASNDTFMWVGQGKDESPAIWQFAGASSQKVSTTAEDNQLQDLSDTELSDVFALSYAQKGAYFADFNLPDTTLSYNAITGRWQDKQSDIVDELGVKETVRWRVNSINTVYGRILVGDSQDGRVGELGLDILAEYDNEIKRTFITQPFSAMGNSLFIPMIELTMESGVGNSEYPDPVVRMSRSEDGHTFGDERTRNVGKRGRYQTRQIWYRNGRAERFTAFKFVVSDKVKVVIIKLEADIRQGSR